MEKDEKNHNSYDETDERKSKSGEDFVKESLAFPAKRKYTIRDYEQLPDDARAELIDGELFVMEAPSFLHQRIVLRLWYQIESFLQEKKGNCVAAAAPLDVRMDRDDYTMLQPDVLVICDRGQITGKRVEGAPDFVCEVVSPSSASKDYIKKTEKYRAAGVREYWIIDADRRTLTTYDFAGDGIQKSRELRGKAGVKIYHDELMIDLDELAAIAERGF